MQRPAECRYVPRARTISVIFEASVDNQTGSDYDAEYQEGAIRAPPLLSVHLPSYQRDETKYDQRSRYGRSQLVEV